jgi:hypothetical protein
MWSLDSFCGYSCYPLFLLTAWFRSSRHLSRRLRFKLPLSLQLGLREIRAFWAGELVIGSLAFVFLMGLAKPLPGWAMEKLPGLRVDAAYSNFALPLAALALGLAWPNLASFSLGVGSRKYALSLAALRDHVLGGAAIEAINRRLELEVASYIDRVIDAAKVDPEDTGAGIVQTLDLNLKGAKLNEPAALGEVTEALSRLARSDFASLFLRISQVRMIPLVDRPKPPDARARHDLPRRRTPLPGRAFDSLGAGAKSRPADSRHRRAPASGSAYERPPPHSTARAGRSDSNRARHRSGFLGRRLRPTFRRGRPLGQLGSDGSGGAQPTGA